VSLPISIMARLFVLVQKDSSQKMLIRDTVARRFKASSSRCGACAHESHYTSSPLVVGRHFFSRTPERSAFARRCRVKIDRSLSLPYIRHVPTLLIIKISFDNVESSFITWLKSNVNEVFRLVVPLLTLLLKYNPLSLTIYLELRNSAEINNSNERSILIFSVCIYNYIFKLKFTLSNLHLSSLFTWFYFISYNYHHCDTQMWRLNLGRVCHA